MQRKNNSLVSIWFDLLLQHLIEKNKRKITEVRTIGHPSLLFPNNSVWQSLSISSSKTDAKWTDLYSCSVFLGFYYLFSNFSYYFSAGHLTFSPELLKMPPILFTTFVPSKYSSSSTQRHLIKTHIRLCHFPCEWIALRGSDCSRLLSKAIRI